MHDFIFNSYTNKFSQISQISVVSHFLEKEVPQKIDQLAEEIV